ncbi:hypothetical protein JR316_0008314 [Psilocybe cubensis]|uniref:Uncharacterized protein n=2 Tax=Psilocybe cubensis TaxID=181762 RepID=A0A8H7XTU0_PSICU|nr:hypothetical protein JR316_0008314 [Psilocybe cubensis]KAH9479719.1 hypothetical protein JR316_0008314 [Psilocybe cubensis]
MATSSFGSRPPLMINVAVNPGGRPGFKNRFLHSLPEQESIEDLGHATRTLPSGSRVIKASFHPPSPNTSPNTSQGSSPRADPLRHAITPPPLISGKNLLTSTTVGPQREGGLIAKPVHLTSGKLQAYLQWPAAEFAAIKAAIKVLAEKHLDIRKPFKDQDVEELASLREEAISEYPVLAGYENDWATNEFLRRLLKNTSSRSKPKV